ncbi:MAG: ribonuclease Y [bacterium]|nr:ribonuclease Y [bacterium]
MVVIQTLIIAAAALLAGLFVGYLIRKSIAEGKIKTAEVLAQDIVVNAGREADAKAKEALLEVKDEQLRLRNELEKENRERRVELQRMERHLTQKEENLERRMSTMEKKEKVLQQRDQENVSIRENLERLEVESRAELERVSGLSREEAKDVLLQKVEDEIRDDAAILIRRIEEEAKEKAESKAREIITVAVQRCAADQVVESTVSVVPLPSDDMKGRIIGREGRNIRAFETRTGVDLIIDDTPEAVILSAFDPVRREVARVALEKLLVDGRIHPARIEELVNKAQAEVDAQIKEEGEKALLETSVQGLHPELVRLLGRLRFRTSYGQNVLQHSKEVSWLAGLMADDLGLDVQLAKRAGLLHDIGKAADHEVEGPHATIGADLAKRYRESGKIIQCIAAHHGEEESGLMEALLVQAGDAISAARPGARRESLENYIKRLEKLENVADSFSGVEKSYAIQAGREVRIMVKPDDIDDLAAVNLAKDIVKRIEDELEFPGQIKVTVIRETRAIEYAK